MTSINIVIQFPCKRDVITHGIPASGLRWFDNDNLMNTLQSNATSDELLLNKIHITCFYFKWLQNVFRYMD